MSDKMVDTLKDENPAVVESVLENKGVMDESYLTKDYSTSDLEKEITDSYKELLKPYIAEHPEKPYTDLSPDRKCRLPGRCALQEYTGLYPTDPRRASGTPSPVPSGTVHIRATEHSSHPGRL